MTNWRGRNLFVKWILVILIVSTFESVLCNAHFGYSNAPVIINDEQNILMNASQIREKTRVPSSASGEIESYAAFLKITYSSDINFFFWYFKAQKADDPATAPVILYLESFMERNLFHSVFGGNGPLFLKPDGSVLPRTDSLTNKNHVIYIDALAGVGFTFTTVPWSSEDVRISVVAFTVAQALLAFYKIFSDLIENDLYIVGNSVSAGTVLYLANYINALNLQERRGEKINLKGLVCANGPLKFYHQLFFGNYLYHVGLIDDHGLEWFTQAESEILQYTRGRDIAKAYDVLVRLMTGRRSIFKTLTGYAHPFNIYEADEPTPDFNSVLHRWIGRSDVRRALHVGNAAYGVFYWETVTREYKPFIMDSAFIIEPVQIQRMLFYTGGFDILYPYPAMVHQLDGQQRWVDLENHKTTVRHPWHLRDGRLAGYTKKTGNLTEALIINAGHFAYNDQPRSTLDLLNRFIRDQF